MRYFNIILRNIFNNIFRNNILEEHIKRGLVVGKNFGIETEVIIDYSHTWLIEIGDNVTLAPRVHILAHDASSRKYLGYTKIGKVKIGDRVFIGASSIILPGVVIGSDVIIGAGSVVTHDIPERQVAAGNPARIICSIDEFLDKKAKELKIYPCFGQEYQIENKVTSDMKKEMNVRMKDRFGFIV